MGQISEALSDINSAKVQVNEILVAMEEKFKIPKKTLRKVAYLYHRQNVTDFETETTEIKETYKAILG